MSRRRLLIVRICDLWRSSMVRVEIKEFAASIVDMFFTLLNFSWHIRPWTALLPIAINNPSFLFKQIVSKSLVS